MNGVVGTIPTNRFTPDCPVHPTGHLLNSALPLEIKRIIGKMRGADAGATSRAYEDGINALVNLVLNVPVPTSSTNRLSGER